MVELIRTNISVERTENKQPAYQIKPAQNHWENQQMVSRHEFCPARPSLRSIFGLLGLENMTVNIYTYETTSTES